MTLKGVKFSKEHKLKISLAHIGKKKPWSTGRQNIGKKRSDEWKKQASLIMVLENKRRIKKGIHNFYKGGLSDKNDIIKHSIEYRLWREAVFARDNWTCQKTGIKGGKLNCHHIRNFAQFPELRFAIDNGITFNRESHNKFHRVYGIKNNNKKQIYEFLNKTEAVIK
jgi:hypothetical protein